MSEHKRIAIFSITYDPFIGGAEVAIQEVTKRLPEFEFDLFTARLDQKLPSKERIGNINVFRVGTGKPLMDKWLYPWRASKLALDKHKISPYGAIHAIMATYAGLAALLFKKRQKNAPYLLTLQSGDSDFFIWLRTWFWYPWYRQIYTKANYITAISRWLEDRARSYGYKEEISRIPNGVDVESFSNKINLEERKVIRDQWRVKDRDFVVITASRLVRKNGIDILIDSINDLPENVKLIIAGIGKDEKQLKSQVASRKLQDRVLFLGHVGHERLPALLQSADVFVRPSRSEGMGNSFIEARIAGLPVLGTDIGGIKDLIKANIVEPIEVNEAEHVAKKIKEVMDKLNYSIQNPQNDVKDNFSWDSIAKQYKKVYESILVDS